MSQTTETPLSENELKFIEMIGLASKAAHQNARDKGWYNQRDALIEAARKMGSLQLVAFAENVLAASMIALEHSELSEGLEGIRKELADDHIPSFTMEEAEAADAIIRIFDRAENRGLRLGLAIVAKMRYNATRPQLHGGKKL